MAVVDKSIQSRPRRGSFKRNLRARNDLTNLCYWYFISVLCNMKPLSLQYSLPFNNFGRNASKNYSRIIQQAVVRPQSQGFWGHWKSMLKTTSITGNTLFGRNGEQHFIIRCALQEIVSLSQQEMKETHLVTNNWCMWLHVVSALKVHVLIWVVTGSKTIAFPLRKQCTEYVQNEVSRSIGVARENPGGHVPQILWISSQYVLWEAVYQTKYCW